MPKYLEFVKAKWFLLVAGLLIGALTILGIRFATYKHEEVHYHANFVVYINGQREEFKDPAYYQPVEMCTLVKEITPPVRAHMHDNVSSVVHVEDNAVTWGQFFNNLGWNVGKNYIQTPDALYTSEVGNNKLHVILNGNDITGINTITNMVIKDKDRLLISYGDSDEQTLNDQYKTVPEDAGKYDAEKDPSTCSGHEDATMRDRFMHML